jgi:hypothetical protein
MYLYNRYRLLQRFAAQHTTGRFPGANQSITFFFVELLSIASLPRLYYPIMSQEEAPTQKVESLAQTTLIHSRMQ